MQTYLWVLLLMLYAPIAIIVIYSFTDAKVLGNWTGFSLDLYKSLLNTGAHHSLMNAFVNTVLIALIAATASTLLGSIAAIGIYNLKARSRKAVGFVNSIPILNGDIITGISLFLLFVSLGITQGFTTVVLAHITFCTPYVVLSVLPRLKQMNPNLYEAALDLGATPMQALRKVILPEIRPGMLSGFLLALTISIDDFAVTVFTIGNQGLETLSPTRRDARKETDARTASLVGCHLYRHPGVADHHSPQSGQREERNMRKYVLYLALLASLLTGCYNEEDSREHVLKVYNWVDYIGEGVLEDFQQYYKEQTGEEIRIVYQTFDINEKKKSKLLTQNRKGAPRSDVVCPSEYIIERMLRKDLLLPIDTVFACPPTSYGSSSLISGNRSTTASLIILPAVMPCVTCGERPACCITGLTSANRI